MMVWYQFAPGWQILVLPGFVDTRFLASIGPGLWITALNVKYRDFRLCHPVSLAIGPLCFPGGLQHQLCRRNGNCSIAQPDGRGH